MKKYLAIGSAMLLMGINSISENESENTDFQNEATITIDFDNNTYTLFQYTGEIVAGSWNGSVLLGTGSFTGIANFFNIDFGNLRVTSDSNNPSNVSLQLIRDLGGAVVNTTDSLEPGDTWNTNVGSIGGHSVRGRVVSGGQSGSYSFSLRW